MEQILSGKSDANIKFEDLPRILLRFGFEEGIKVSHHSFRKAGIEEYPNLRRDGDKAETYQVRQVRNILQKYDLKEN